MVERLTVSDQHWIFEEQCVCVLCCVVLLCTACVRITGNEEEEQTMEGSRGWCLWKEAKDGEGVNGQRANANERMFFDRAGQ